MKFTTRKTPADPVVIEFTGKPGLDQAGVEAIVTPALRDFGLAPTKITFTCTDERRVETTKLQLGYHDANYRVEAFV